MFIFQHITERIADVKHFLRSFPQSFLFLIGITYFMVSINRFNLQQGFRSYSFGDGIMWFYSHNFGSAPGTTQVYISAISLTWGIKMIYGLIFDNFPLFGRHDKPWMLVSTATSVVGFIGLVLSRFLTKV
jgi:hypothetical protein